MTRCATLANGKVTFMNSNRPERRLALARTIRETQKRRKIAHAEYERWRYIHERQNQ